MMESIPLKTFVVLHVTLVLNYLAVILGPVRVMGAGVVLILRAIEVCMYI